MGALLFASVIVLILLGFYVACSSIVALSGVLIFSVMIFVAKFLFVYIREVRSNDQQPPVAGLVFNQLIHFTELFDYQASLAQKYLTYRMILPSHSEIYTADPVNVEYILKTNFTNYGKVIKLFMCMISFHEYLDSLKLQFGCNVAAGEVSL